MASDPALAAKRSSARQLTARRRRGPGGPRRRGDAGPRGAATTPALERAARAPQPPTGTADKSRIARQDERRMDVRPPPPRPIRSTRMQRYDLQLRHHSGRRAVERASREHRSSADLTEGACLVRSFEHAPHERRGDLDARLGPWRSRGVPPTRGRVPGRGDTGRDSSRRRSMKRGSRRTRVAITGLPRHIASSMGMPSPSARWSEIEARRELAIIASRSRPETYPSTIAMSSRSAAASPTRRASAACAPTVESCFKTTSAPSLEERMQRGRPR